MAAKMTALTIAMASAVSVSAAPAASAGSGQCGGMCLWEHSYYDGSALKLGNNIPDLRRVGWNDRGSSAVNDGRFITWCFYEHINYRGKVSVFPPGKRSPYFYSKNDTFSSVRSC